LLAPKYADVLQVNHFSQFDVVTIGITPNEITQRRFLTRLG